MSSSARERTLGEAAADDIFSGSGEVRTRCRELDWAATSLGAVERWPPTLRTLAALVMASAFPSALLWGPEHNLLYNDAFAPLLGDEHPTALGRPVHAVFPELQPVSAALLTRVLGGESITMQDHPFLVQRGGAPSAPEERRGSLCHTPVRDAAGAIVGIHVAAVDSTAQATAPVAPVERERLHREADDARRAAASILAAVGDGVLGLDIDGRNTFANDAASRLLGYTPEEIIGAEQHELIHHHHPDATVYAQEDCSLLKALRAGEACRGEEWFWRKDGTAFPAAYSITPVFDDGRVTGAVVTFSDITEQRRAEAERERLLRESEALRAQAEAGRAWLGELFRQAPAFIAVVRGRDFIFEMANDDYFQLVGHRAILGKPVREALPEVVEQGFIELLEQVLETGEPFVGREVPVVLARVPGAPPEERFVNFVFQPINEADGTRSGIFAHGVDITDQVLARREVEQARIEAEAERRRLALVLDRLPVGVVLVNSGGAVVHYNRALQTVLGHPVYPAADLSGYALYGGVHPDGRPYAPEDYPVARALLRGEEVLRELTRYRRGDGRLVTLSISAAPVRDAEGAVVYAVAVIEDVDDREAARAEAEEANRSKSEFLAVMSHELRTPLNAIGGYAELIEIGVHGPVTAEQRTALERIQRSQRHLLGLINGVLNYAKVDAGAVHYEITDVRMHEVLASCEALTAPQVRGKGLTLRYDACARSLVARADGDKVQQIVLNLLSNAVKFTEPGGELTMDCAMRDDGVIAVGVSDTGRGIDADQLERVFHPFVQVDTRLTRTHEGTGLGLAISRDLARGMGGDITVESTLGVGSTFTLTLPSAG